MHLDFSEGEMAFRQEVRDFIHSYFTPENPSSSSPADKKIWHAALIEKGWQVYKWPVAFGGTGWTMTEKFIWERETKAAGLLPQLDGMGVSMIGLPRAGTPLGTGMRSAASRTVSAVLSVSSAYST